MALSGEWSLLGKISEQIKAAQGDGIPSLVKGIGDDCAVYRIAPDRYGLFTTDISIEGSHFLTAKTPLHHIGYKAMAGNISDIAAMGGTPLLALVSLGIPGDEDDARIEELYQGIIDAATEAGLSISGGDIARAEGLTISITLYGETEGSPIYRKGAAVGDTIYVTGHLGASGAGLKILLGDRFSRETTFPFRELLSRHELPPVRSRAVPELRSIFRPTAMIDISDGLVGDLGHICEASSTGFLLNCDAIPRLPILEEYALQEKKKLSDLILHSGEEYELLFTSPIGGALPRNLPCEVTAIGEIRASGLYLREGDMERELSPATFDHFK